MVQQLVFILRFLSFSLLTIILSMAMAAIAVFTQTSPATPRPVESLKIISPLPASVVSTTAQSVSSAVHTIVKPVK